MSIDQFGFTIATLSETDVTITTRNSTSFDDNKEEKSNYHSQNLTTVRPELTS